MNILILLKPCIGITIDDMMSVSRPLVDSYIYHLPPGFLSLRKEEPLPELSPYRYLIGVYTDHLILAVLA